MGKKEPSKGREWERHRRDRLNHFFSDLAKVLPDYDPSLVLSKVVILEKAIKYIKELKQKNKKLVLGTEGANEQVDMVKNLEKRVEDLLSRNLQLSNLLKMAGITPPNEPGIGPSLGKRPMKWSNQLSSGDIENAGLVNAPKKRKADKNSSTCNGLGDGTPTSQPLSHLQPNAKTRTSKQAATDVSSSPPSSSDSMPITSSAARTTSGNHPTTTTISTSTSRSTGRPPTVAQLLLSKKTSGNTTKSDPTAGITTSTTTTTVSSLTVDTLQPQTLLQPQFILIQPPTTSTQAPLQYKDPAPPAVFSSGSGLQQGIVMTKSILTSPIMATGLLPMGGSALAVNQPTPQTFILTSGQLVPVLPSIPVMSSQLRVTTTQADGGHSKNPVPLRPAKPDTPPNKVSIPPLAKKSAPTTKASKSSTKCGENIRSKKVASTESEVGSDSCGTEGGKTAENVRNANLQQKSTESVSSDALPPVHSKESQPPTDPVQASVTSKDGQKESQGSGVTVQENAVNSSSSVTVDAAANQKSTYSIAALCEISLENKSNAEGGDSWSANVDEPSVTGTMDSSSGGGDGRSDDTSGATATTLASSLSNSTNDHSTTEEKSLETQTEPTSTNQQEEDAGTFLMTRPHKQPPSPTSKDTSDKDKLDHFPHVFGTAVETNEVSKSLTSSLPRSEMDTNVGQTTEASSHLVPELAAKLATSLEQGATSGLPIDTPCFLDMNDDSRTSANAGLNLPLILSVGATFGDVLHLPSPKSVEAVSPTAIFLSTFPIVSSSLSKTSEVASESMGVLQMESEGQSQQVKETFVDHALSSIESLNHKEARILETSSGWAAGGQTYGSHTGKEKTNSQSTAAAKQSHWDMVGSRGKDVEIPPSKSSSMSEEQLYNLNTPVKKNAVSQSSSSTSSTFTSYFSSSTVPEEQSFSYGLGIATSGSITPIATTSSSHVSTKPSFMIQTMLPPNTVSSDITSVSAHSNNSSSNNNTFSSSAESQPHATNSLGLPQSYSVSSIAESAHVTRGNQQRLEDKMSVSRSTENAGWSSVSKASVSNFLVSKQRGNQSSDMTDVFAHSSQLLDSKSSTSGTVSVESQERQQQYPSSARSDPFHVSHTHNQKETSSMHKLHATTTQGTNYANPMFLTSSATSFSTRYNLTSTAATATKDKMFGGNQVNFSQPWTESLQGPSVPLPVMGKSNKAGMPPYPINTEPQDMGTASISSSLALNIVSEPLTTAETEKSKVSRPMQTSDFNILAWTTLSQSRMSEAEVCVAGSKMHATQNLSVDGMYQTAPKIQSKSKSPVNWMTNPVTTITTTSIPPMVSSQPYLNTSFHLPTMNFPSPHQSFLHQSGQSASSGKNSAVGELAEQQQQQQHSSYGTQSETNNFSVLDGFNPGTHFHGSNPSQSFPAKSHKITTQVQQWSANFLAPKAPVMVENMYQASHGFVPTMDPTGFPTRGNAIESHGDYLQQGTPLPTQLIESSNLQYGTRRKTFPNENAAKPGSKQQKLKSNNYNALGNGGGTFLSVSQLVSTSQTNAQSGNSASQKRQKSGHESSNMSSRNKVTNHLIGDGKKTMEAKTNLYSGMHHQHNLTNNKHKYAPSESVSESAMTNWTATSSRSANIYSAESIVGNPVQEPQVQASGDKRLLKSQHHSHQQPPCLATNNSNNSQSCHSLPTHFVDSAEKSLASSGAKSNYTVNGNFGPPCQQTPYNSNSFAYPHLPQASAYPPPILSNVCYPSNGSGPCPSTAQVPNTFAPLAQDKGIACQSNLSLWDQHGSQRSGLGVPAKSNPLELNPHVMDSQQIPIRDKRKSNNTNANLPTLGDTNLLPYIPPPHNNVEDSSHFLTNSFLSTNSQTGFYPPYAPTRAHDIIQQPGLSNHTAIPPTAAGNQSNSLTSFNLSAIFPEINDKQNVPAPPPPLAPPSVNGIHHHHHPKAGGVQPTAPLVGNGNLCGAPPPPLLRTPDYRHMPSATSNCLPSLHGNINVNNLNNLLSHSSTEVGLGLNSSVSFPAGGLSSVVPNLAFTVHEH